MSKPNCYECKYRKNIPGNCHSQCAHPAFKKSLDDPMAQILGIFASVGRGGPVSVVSTDCIVTANPHGIQNGWFNHPFNFDPTWLKSCTGFEAKEEVVK
jgi:hypothetical protein